MSFDNHVKYMIHRTACGFFPAGCCVNKVLMAVTPQHHVLLYFRQRDGLFATVPEVKYSVFV